MWILTVLKTDPNPTEWQGQMMEFYIHTDMLEWVDKNGVRCFSCHSIPNEPDRSLPFLYVCYRRFIGSQTGKQIYLSNVPDGYLWRISFLKNIGVNGKLSGDGAEPMHFQTAQEAIVFGKTRGYIVMDKDVW